MTILSAFLRLAETLDRSRHGVIRGIEVRDRLGLISIRVQAVGDAELEVWAAHKQASALEEALDRKVRIEKIPYRKGLKAINTELAHTKRAAGVNSRISQAKQQERRQTERRRERPTA